MNPATAHDLVTAVLATADALLRESQRLFRPYGLTGAQFNLLNIIAGHGAGLSQREISDLLVVDRSNVTGLTDRMEKAGWVRRTNHPEDRRAYRVVLTEAGRALWTEVEPRYRIAVAQVAYGLPERRMRETTATLRQLETAAPRLELGEKKL